MDEEFRLTRPLTLKLSTEHREQLARYPHLHCSPLLLGLVHYYAQQQHWSEQQLFTVYSKSLPTLIESIGLANTKENCELLTQAQQSDPIFKLSSDSEGLALLYRFFKDQIPGQLAPKPLPRDISKLKSLARLLVNCPELIQSRFMRRCDLERLRYYRCRVCVQSIVRWAELLEVNSWQRSLRRCRHLKDLRCLHARLHQQANQRVLERLPQLDLKQLPEVLQAIGCYLEMDVLEDVERYWFDDYGTSPLPGTSSHVPIRSFQDLFQEAMQQNNCSLQYYPELKLGMCLFYSVLAPERATLLLERNPKTQRYRISQLVLQNNRPVASSTLRAVKQWLKAVQTKTEVIKS